MPQRLYALTWRDAVLAGITFLLALTLYVRTLAPGLLLGDSAEFQTLTYTLGMTHPTGYPVYLLVARLFSLLPVGNLAYRVNLCSAFLGALTIALLTLNGRMLVGWRMAALAGPLVLALTPLYWWLSVIAELYTAAAALLIAIVTLMLLWRQTGSQPYLFAAGLLGGLSLGVHPTVALAAPAVLVYLLLTVRMRNSWFAAIGGVLAGVALALVAFVAIDAHDPPSSYYHATARHGLSLWHLVDTDFDSPVERMRFLFTARQFQHAMFADPSARMPANASIYWARLKQGFPPLGLVLMLVGVWALFARGRWREAAWLLLIAVPTLVFVLNYDVFDMEVFYLPTYVILALLLSAGAGALLDGVTWVVARSARTARHHATATAVIGAVVLAGLAGPASARVRDAWAAGRITFLDHTSTAQYPYPVQAPEYPHAAARRLVERLEDNAIVFSNWDFLYTYYFVAHVEAGRTGMAFLEPYPQSGVPTLAESTLKYIDVNIGTRPIYFVERPDPTAYRHYRIAAVDKGGGVQVYQVVDALKAPD